MLYFCADDYGLDDISSMHIKKCIDEGILNKVSVFPNFNEVDLQKISENKEIRLSLHLNLVEGKCMADKDAVKLITDKNGNFKYTFGGLFKKSLINPKEFENQIYKEIKAQVKYWKSILPDGVGFCIDSHQHTHMIPKIFKALMQVLDDEKITAEYIRIPAEPILPFIKAPSLYFTYSGINVIKQWLLNFLWMLNKRNEKCHVPTAYFFGILFSGKMDEKRVRRILPEFIKAAEKNNRDVEVLFHPGYIKNIEKNNLENIVFNKFYLSQNRKTEFDSVMNLTEGSAI